MLCFSESHSTGRTKRIRLDNRVQQRAAGVVDFDPVMVSVGDVDSSARAVNRNSKGEEPEMNQRLRFPGCVNRKRVIDIAAVQIARRIKRHDKSGFAERIRRDLTSQHIGDEPDLHLGVRAYYCDPPDKWQFR